MDPFAGTGRDLSVTCDFFVHLKSAIKIIMKIVLLISIISVGIFFSFDTKKKTLLEQVTSRKIPTKDLLIFIDKSAYELKVKYKDEVLITYPCVFGFNAKDDKKQEGDGCTPEGNFGIVSMYPHKSWSFFIWIDYPNAKSWEKFNSNKKNKVIPQDATIGGQVGIHGVPKGSDDLISSKTNWTLGCISLTTADITDLYKSIGKSTKILVVK